MIEKKYQRRMILDKKDRDGLKSLLKEIEARRVAATHTPGHEPNGRDEND